MWGNLYCGEKGLFIFHTPWLSIEFFLTACSGYQGEQPWMAVQPSQRHGCRIDGGPETAVHPNRLLEKSD